jgi:cysteine synthase B
MTLPAKQVPAPDPAIGPVDLVDLVGTTPLLDLSTLLEGEGVSLYGKAELANPGGSVKDRPARAMILAAEAQGRLRQGRRILDATSGNTGIALAMIGAARGYGVTLCMAANASAERKRLLRALGAELVLTDPLAGSDGAILEARRLLEADPDRYVYVDQYSNPENWQAHYRTTGPEIWRQTGGQVTHFITGLGTSGTFMGTGRYLKERSPSVRLISMEPDGPLHGLEGMKHMASAIVPPIYDPSLADETTTVSTEEAYVWARKLARELGLLLGVSAAANVAAAHRLASTLEEGVVVTVLCDGAAKYLSEPFWEEP